MHSRTLSFDQNLYIFGLISWWYMCKKSTYNDSKLYLKQILSDVGTCGENVSHETTIYLISSKWPIIVKITQLFKDNIKITAALPKMSTYAKLYQFVAAFIYKRTKKYTMWNSISNKSQRWLYTIINCIGRLIYVQVHFYWQLSPPNLDSVTVFFHDFY